MKDAPANKIERRAPETVMRLSRLGSFHQSRLSFMRILTRRMAREGWHFSRPQFEIDTRGVGHAVYTATGPERAYSLIAFAHDLPPEMRSDRVIATAWDATFTLFDGIPTPADIERLRANVPLQEAGRVSARELSVSRANRSVRLWAQVVEALSEGRQPDPQELSKTGYLMRTTAVYGSGKLGAADYATIQHRPEMSAPFQAEMLSVYLTRAFVRDLVNHMARARGGAKAVPLDPALARGLGIGNSTGLGLGPFILNHPRLFNNWIAAREKALARVRRVEHASADDIALFHRVLKGGMRMLSRWQSAHPVQVDKLSALRADADRINAHLDRADLGGAAPWDRLYRWAEGALSEEGQEWLASLMLEPYGALIDDLAGEMADRTPASTIDGAMPVATMTALIEQVFGWALALDWTSQEAQARIWYVSEAKLEPRLGERFEEPLAPYEQPLAPARDAVAFHETLSAFAVDTPLSDVLRAHPEHRHIARRLQGTVTAPYGEVRDNTIDAALFPVDLLRVKLAFFGACAFDPRSDRWLRICMYPGAPYPEDLCPDNADLWVYGEGAA
ncbi:hypothetical protein [Rhodalgimonas zhirmunskyi]|uniref:Uncharacterized protein n=1 Tax=Rhodalgimonas zhirmunskyi TaxID=2964767 RepID=A0AAJ1U6M0_9RHOB|nr:hypothetical protein [Rhodoalgimonas zhirmunskyi]MDQ2094441.1 hypothetical protein [Rhodoalgimonas zhirmunskyi]